MDRREKLNALNLNENIKTKIEKNIGFLNMKFGDKEMSGTATKLTKRFLMTAAHNVVMKKPGQSN